MIAGNTGIASIISDEDPHPGRFPRFFYRMAYFRLATPRLAVVKERRGYPQ